MKHLLGHILFYKVSGSSKYMVASGFVLILIYIFQVVSGVVITFGVNNKKELVYNIHSLLPSVFIFFIYAHIYKSVYYRWASSISGYSAFVSGWMAFLLLIVTCFSGYLIPWGQLSFWGTQVVTSFLDYIPVFGERLKILIWGSLSIEESITKIRFKSIHIILGISLTLLIILHLYFVHDKESVFLPFNNLSDVFNYSYMYPLFYLKDFFISIIVIFLLALLFIIYRDYLEESGNVLKANPSVTPNHIVPEWYFLPTYSILKYFPNAVLGILFGFFLISSINTNCYSMCLCIAKYIGWRLLDFISLILVFNFRFIRVSYLLYKLLGPNGVYIKLLIIVWIYLHI